MRWRASLAVSVGVLALALFGTPPLLDVTTGATPDGVRLAYPLVHILFAPVSLSADWLNAGSRADLVGFVAWALGIFAVMRVAARPAPSARPRLVRETVYGIAFLLGLLAFVAWVVYVPRAIPRLVAGGPEDIVFDIHSHTAASRDGRRGFDLAASAEWHGRAGFDAAFITDHNVASGARPWGAADPDRRPRLLEGEELSLRGLHVIVLGNAERIANEPYNDTWDSTLLLLERLRDAGPAGRRPYLIASLPEYWRHHWGADIGRMVAAGIEGFEVWTTSPKAMEIPDTLRREVVARARLERLGLFGATDMHGIGHTASVWNVTALPGWRQMDDAALTWALIGRFRDRAAGPVRVVVLRRWLPAGRAGALLAVPLGLVTAIRTASVPHVAALLGWIWLAALLPPRPRPQR